VRIAIVILSLAVMAVGLVHLRRAELIARHESQQLQLQQVKLRRQLWDQQIDLSYLATPAEVRRRSEEMCLDLVDKNGSAVNSPSGSLQDAGPVR
jgi:hypothetical protein